MSKPFEKPHSRTERRGKFPGRWDQRLMYHLHRHTTKVRPEVIELQKVLAAYQDEHCNTLFPGTLIAALWDGHTDAFNRALEDRVLTAA